MTWRVVLIFAVGILLFGIGALAHTYMKLRIGKAHSDCSGTRSTEVKYMGLVKTHEAPMWPLLVAVTFTPLGVITSFAAVIWSNHAK